MSTRTIHTPSVIVCNHTPLESFIEQNHIALSHLIPWMLRERCPNLDELTAQEIKIVLEVIRGQSDVEIATRLQAARTTVGTHLHHILNKLRVRSRTEAATLVLFLLLDPHQAKVHNFLEKVHESP